MLCSQCGKENQDSAVYCISCGTPLSSPVSPPVVARTDGWAVAALVLGILGICTLGALAIPGLICGIIALGRISHSRGKRGGQDWAFGGIALSGGALLILPLAAASFVPMLLRLSERNVHAMCLNEMRNLSLAMQLYTDDYDQQSPPTVRWKNTVSTPSSPK